MTTIHDILDCPRANADRCALCRDVQGGRAFRRSVAAVAGGLVDFACPLDLPWYNGAVSADAAPRPANAPARRERPAAAILDSRRAICGGCDQRIGAQCRQHDGCLSGLQTNPAGACPVGKWPAVSVQPTAHSPQPIAQLPQPTAHSPQPLERSPL